MDVTQTTPAPWIKLSETTGRFTPSDRHFEDRIRVSIDWNVYALDPVSYSIDLKSRSRVPRARMDQCLRPEC
jgi:hypothetical protein